MAQGTGSFSNNTTDKAHDKGRPTSGTNKCGNAQNEREEGNDQRAGLVLSDLDGLDFGLLAGSLTVSASISVGDCGDRDVCAFGGGFLEQRRLNHKRTSPGSRSLLEKRRAHHERAGSRLRGHFGRKII